MFHCSWNFPERSATKTLFINFFFETERKKNNLYKTWLSSHKGKKKKVLWKDISLWTFSWQWSQSFLPEMHTSLQLDSPIIKLAGMKWLFWDFCFYKLGEAWHYRKINSWKFERAIHKEIQSINTKILSSLLKWGKSRP